MGDPNPRFVQIFCDIFESLPRQGPGNRACTARALSMCRDLPASPAIIDLGCGAGGQTLHLAELTSGTIVAVDNHGPNIDRLKAKAIERGLSSRISPVVGDLATLQQPQAHFDLVWSEGALYNIGLESALPICYGLLQPGGYLAFSDAVWCKDNPPPEVKACFEGDYPTMGRVADALIAIEKSGFSLIDHFTLPDEAWWHDFYTPMQLRIDALRKHYADDHEALGILDQISQEPETHRQHSDYYAYEFFVARR